jgi:hypothetical protein
MKRIGSIVAALALAGALEACATGAAAPLKYFADEPDPARIDSLFAEEIITHFGAKAKKAKVEKRLEGVGFRCADVPPVEARGDYLIARCTRPKPHGLCTDSWNVELRYAGDDSIAPHGTFRRACIAVATPNG